MNVKNPKKLETVGQVAFSTTLKMTDDSTARQKIANDLMSALGLSMKTLYRATGGTIKILIQPNQTE